MNARKHVGDDEVAKLAKEYSVPECVMYKLNLHEWRDVLAA
jgi:hypothetical protein